MSNSLFADGLKNVYSGLGTAKSKQSGYRWDYGFLNDFQQLDAAYQESWLARQIVNIPAEDMTREWRRIKSEGAEEVEALENQLNISNKVEDAIRWSRLYGGAGILMLTGQDLSQPLDINKIKKGDLKRLLVFDRWDLGATTINTHDVIAPNFNMPERYIIRGGAQEVHWSHIVRFLGEKLPLRQMTQTTGWGDSVLRKCLTDLNEIIGAHGGIAELMTESNVDVLTMEGLAEDLSTDQESTIIKRYETFNLMKSSVNLALLDGTEKLDRKTLNLSGVAPILEHFLTWVSGASRIPVTKLFGTSAKGMNATGEGDLKTYYDDIRSLQSSVLSEPLRQLDEIMVRSALGSFPEQFDYQWNPLAQPNDLEIAQVNQLRGQTDIMYLDTGIVQRSQIQRELQANEQYQFNDDDIKELEELESPNMFEEKGPAESPEGGGDLVDPGGAE